MDENPCFLCRDNGEIMYKICDCVDSIICEECYDNEETSKMDKCGICRKDYDFNYTKDYNMFFQILIKTLSKYGIILGIELFPPIYFYFKSEYAIINNIYFILCLNFIIFGNIINYKLLSLFIDTDENISNIHIIFLPLKLIYIVIFFFIILYGYNKNQINVYFYFIIMCIYIIPIILFSIGILLINCQIFKKNINDKTLKRTIKIKSIIQSTHTSSQNAINNV